MNIAKAVVLAMDSRGPEPWPSLGLSTQHLAPVANKPVLFHHLEALAQAGIGETAIVCDRRSHRAIREAVGDGSAWELDVHYIESSPQKSVLESSAVAGFVGSESVVVQPGDILLHESLSSLREQFALDGLDALVMHAGGAQDRAAVTDCYLLGDGVYPHLRRDPAPLSDALARLRARGARIEERDVDACLPCRGGTDALLTTNRRLLENLRADLRGERIFDSKVHGRLALDPSAEVRDSVIRGPVSIGPRARITNSYIGPYTSIGPGVIVDGAEIEHSIVLDNAEIRNLAPRVESSIIGPGARVAHDFEMPRAVRLSIGEGAHVSLT